MAPEEPMPDIVISEFMDVAAVDGLRSEFEVLYDPELVDRPADLETAVAGARGLIVRNRTQVTPELLAAAPRLQAVGRLGVGLDNIDLDACEGRGVAVFPATGANAASVAEYVVAAVMSLTRAGFAATDRVAAGAWPRTELVGREVGGRRLGLVGFGTIARQVAARARGLGMEIAAYDPFVDATDPVWENATRMELEELLGSCDLSIHVPLTDDTRNLIDAAAIAAMPDGAVLVNTARGGIVDEEALIDALRSGRLGGAALDVFAAEPVDEESGARFAGVPNLILTPHIAGITEESNTRVSRVTAENVARALRG